MSNEISGEKLNQLEETIAHQEIQLQDLNDVVTRQSKEIDQLLQYIGKLNDKIANVEQSLEEGGSKLSVSEQAAIDKPPHY